MKKILYITIILFVFLSFSNVVSAQTADDIDLLWEAETYTPPFYTGRPLITVGASVRVVAIVDVVNPQSLNYRWRFNNYGIAEQSGVGKDTFVFTSSPRNNTVTLELVDENGAVISNKSISLQVSDPEIYIYKNNPALGTLFGQSWGDEINTTDTEITLEAYPFFFASERDSYFVDYEWKINRNLINNNSPKITLRDGGVGGSVSISLSARDKNNLFSRASQQLRLIFGDI